MKKLEISGSGFDVLHNSEEWRIALHSFCEEINGPASFRKWGRHMDSEEAFVLLSGKAYLVFSEKGQEDEDYRICPLETGRMLLAEKGERHAILLGEGAKVLIFENLDMSNTVNEPIRDAVIRAVLSAWEKES